LTLVAVKKRYLRIRRQYMIGPVAHQQLPGKQSPSTQIDRSRNGEGPPVVNPLYLTRAAPAPPPTKAADAIVTAEVQQSRSS
jgi:hypothetical protein